MAEPSQGGLTGILAKETWTAEEHSQLLKELFSTYDAAAKFKGMLGELEARDPDPKGPSAIKIGIGRYMVCRFQDALTVLANGTDNKDRRFFQGLCYKQLRQFDKAVEELHRARERGWDGPEVDVNVVECLALKGDLDAAEKALKDVARKIAETPDSAYLTGLIAELRGFGEQAVEAYEKARAQAPGHPAATFRLAYFHDLHGDEQRAVDLYKECISRPPVHANALLNLAVLYEDAGDYDKSISCLRRILATDRNHPRVKLFLRDAESSKTMYYDEDQARRLAKRNAVLDIPVTDFELSVRARNCLKKMNIRTLGDLVNITESELLGYKNFGETSLKEIKEMLSAKGLRLGQALEEGSDMADVATPRRSNVSNEGVLATPIEHIEFSIRSRRALDSLKITTLGELIAKTEVELLACRNFGQTSLNEVRQRLAEYGLHLRDGA